MQYVFQRQWYHWFPLNPNTYRHPHDALHNQGHIPCSAPGLEKGQEGCRTAHTRRLKWESSEPSSKQKEPCGLFCSYHPNNTAGWEDSKPACKTIYPKIQQPWEASDSCNMETFHELVLFLPSVHRVFYCGVIEQRNFYLFVLSIMF